MKNTYLNLTKLKQSISALAIFIPYCFGPATLFTVASIILVIGNTCTFAQLNNPTLSLNTLLTAAVILLASFAIGIVLLAIGLSKWVFVLLVFCRFWLYLSSEKSQIANVRELQQQTIIEIKNRQNFLARFWLFTFLFMLLPLIIFCVAIVIKLASFRSLLGYQALTLPQSLDTILIIVIFVLGLSLTIISLVAVPVAATSDEAIMPTVKKTFRLSWEKLPQAALLSIVILTLNALIASPQLLTKYANFESYLLPSANLSMVLIEQIWQGLVSVILFPLSLIPFCELLRNSITNLVKTN